MPVIKLWPGLSWAGHCTGGGSQLWLSPSSPLSTTKLGLGEAGADGRASWGPGQAPPPQGKGALEPPGRSRDSVWGLARAAQSSGQAAA